MSGRHFIAHYRHRQAATPLSAKTIRYLSQVTSIAGLKASNLARVQHRQCRRFELHREDRVR